MNLAGTDELSAELTDIIRGVAGVNAVYAAMPLLSTIVSTISTASSGAIAASPNLVSFERRDDAVEVLVSIGVGSEEPAPEVCRRVHDVVAVFLAAREGDMPYEIAVKVGSVS